MGGDHRYRGRRHFGSGGGMFLIIAIMLALLVIGVFYTGMYG